MEKKNTSDREDSFWAKYSKFAVNEILLYLIMVIGIVIGLLILT